MLLLLSTLLIGFIPYEDEIVRVFKLITTPVDALSGLGGKMPLFLGILFDIFFYPIITFFLLFLSFIVVYSRSKKIIR